MSAHRGDGSIRVNSLIWLLVHVENSTVCRRRLVLRKWGGREERELNVFDRDLLSVMFLEFLNSLNES